ncbi:putative membrane protein YdjX (TVP38/TMEM64 family) [Kibdelosporangium banguiense]|uniref:TVP38/TMEM64 family membrane protein n=1 Tax=Kibdelosporangium banguiense TaxID=1365924 RepID=A0ABS4T624_9PSEU|nr:TVP38/TMEM64 family protein [Kibdelosporangium banguiense]MBP2319888.1 putative membrane protein YdjX (TVP38/TMEM64 family) [Kibdelosporangium banguiense]
MPRVRTALALGLLAVLVAAAFVLPIPGPSDVRTWALSAGAAAPLLMFVMYVVATIAPVPRTVFSLASGLLLGPVVGVLVAMSATALSAVLGFALARWVGRGLMARHLDKAAVKTVDERLADGGWLSVASLRMIPLIPFTPMNYCCGVSSVRLWPFLLGTVVGSVPGTTAAVLIGDTLTGFSNPTGLIISAVCAVIGAAGLLIVIRRPKPAAVTAQRDISVD